MPSTHTTLQFRAYTSRAGYHRLDEVLDMTRRLYNAALEHRRAAYRREGVSVTLYDQTKELTGIRADNPRWEALAAVVSRGSLVRLDRAFKAFFRRVKAGQTPGFPRFKSASRWETIELSDVTPGMVRLTRGGRKGQMRVKGLPRMEFRLGARPLPESSALKSIRISRKGRRIILNLAYEVDKEPLSPRREVQNSIGEV